MPFYRYKHTLIQYNRHLFRIVRPRTRAKPTQITFSFAIQCNQVTLAAEKSFIFIRTLHLNAGTFSSECVFEARSSTHKQISLNEAKVSSLHIKTYVNAETTGRPPVIKKKHRNGHKSFVLWARLVSFRFGFHCIRHNFRWMTKTLASYRLPVFPLMLRPFPFRRPPIQFSAFVCAANNSVFFFARPHSLSLVLFNSALLCCAVFFPVFCCRFSSANLFSVHFALYLCVCLWKMLFIQKICALCCQF